MSKKKWSKWWSLPALSVLLAGGATLGCIGLCIGFPCMTPGIRYGVWTKQCSLGELRLGADVNASGLVRGQAGPVYVVPKIRLLRQEYNSTWVEEETMDRGFSTTLSLLDADGNVVADGITYDNKSDFGDYGWPVVLAAVPDGDYTLRAHVEAPFESVDVDVPLPLYAPALAHLMTDRPLYKPGQDVLLRAAMLRRTDLSPIDGRPGVWKIIAPDGSEMLIEKDKAGAWGIADTSFPLDAQAQVGQWTAIWTSGLASDTVTFDVRPFRLPRASVEMSASQPWYTAGDAVALTGTAHYNSGAPVANASVEVQLIPGEGRWPLPLDWETPFSATTDAFGKFNVDIGDVPADLLERRVISARVRVTEEAGETTDGSASLVLSQYPLKVEAVTEFGEGLVGGFNNRAYVRLTTPDGRPVADTDVAIRAWWDESAKLYPAKTDVDGVAAFQLDPGDPVTVVIEAPPFRPHPVVAQPPSLQSGNVYPQGRSLDLSERSSLDRVVSTLASCGDYTNGGQNVAVSLQIDTSGSVRRVLADDSPAGACVTGVLRGLRFESGDFRTLALNWYIPDTQKPALVGSSSLAQGLDNGVGAVFDAAALRARRCFTGISGNNGEEAVAAHWSLSDGSSAIDVSFGNSRNSGLAPATQACLKSSFAGLSLPDAADGDAMGTALYALRLPTSSRENAPQSYTMTGYQLRVSTTSGEERVAPLIFTAGAIPDLRIRATPTLAKAGDVVEFKLIRGPNFYGDLPEKLYLQEGGASVSEALVDAKAGTASFTIPDDRDGFLHVDYGNARAVVFVEPKDRLAVSLATDKPKYRPGETATLTVTTSAGGQPVAAGVGLVGVDNTLGQLAPLLGPDEYGRITVRETADQPAFGTFDPKALVLGQIHGENAAKATVLRLTNLPMDPAGDDATYASGHSIDHDTEVLTTNFYRVLGKVTDDVHAWEASAPAGDWLTNDKMVVFWNKALSDVGDGRGEAVDAFARPLTLDILPQDLLVQVDPRQIVSDTTRLPEDILSWTRFIDEEIR